MSFDSILSGKFYFDNRFQDLEIGIFDGKIAKIGRNLTGATKKSLEGAIMPAGTDIHVHFRDPGETHKEDFKSGTISAAFGGTTTVYDMPNNKPAITDYATFGDKLASVSNRAFVDFGLYTMFTGENIAIMDKRSSAIKIYLGGSTNALPAAGISKSSLNKLKELSKPVLFHGEDAVCLKAHERQEVNSLVDHNLSRPEECEINAAETIKEFAIPRSVMGHVSTPGSLTVLGDSIQSEVTPHHILLNDGSESGTWGKVNPPLREKKTQEENLQTFLDGKFSILSSDHAPHTEREKEEFAQAPSGIIGVETRIPLMLALIQKKILDFKVFYDAAVRRPAELMGLKKGKIEIGYYADFFSFRLSDVSRINQERLHSKVTVSPFHEFYAVFPENVYIRGDPVIESREMIDDRRGRHVTDL